MLRNDEQKKMDMLCGLVLNYKLTGGPIPDMSSDERAFAASGFEHLASSLQESLSQGIATLMAPEFAKEMAGLCRNNFGRIDSRYTVIEKRSVERAYGFFGTDAIIDHRVFGRMFICDGFGGMSTLRGGAVRWEHGRILQLRDTDTFADLDKDASASAYMSILTRALEGYDPDRPVRAWYGAHIVMTARVCGL